MTQQDLLYLMRKPQLDDLAVNEYGDRAYGTPESTLWNDAYERARARIENPRVLAPGITYGGQTGNLDTPEMVNEQVFKPLEEAFRPESTRDRALEAQISHQRALEQLAAQRMDLTGKNYASLQAEREARRLALMNKPPEMDTITDVYPAVDAVPSIPAREEGKWNPFVANRMIPEVPGKPYQPERRVVRKVPSGSEIAPAMASEKSPPPVMAPTAPSSSRIRVRGPNGETGTVAEGVVLPPGWTRQ